MNKLTRGILTAGLLISIAPMAQAYSVVSLRDAFNNNLVLNSGDKQFSNWFISEIGINASDVMIHYGSDVVDQFGNYGLCFETPTLNVTGANEPKDLGIGFVVTATAKDRLITDVHLSIKTLVSGNAGASVGESWVSPTYNASGGLSTYDFGNGLAQNSDVDFVIPGAKYLSILKDARVGTFDNQRGSASITEICQYFSQSGPVPEPGNVAFIVASGLMSIGLLKRRRK